MVDFLLGLLVVSLLVCLAVIGWLWTACQESRRAAEDVARRLDYDVRVELATLRTITAMRDTARHHLRQSS